jgi:hypothetical protein
MNKENNHIFDGYEILTLDRGSACFIHHEDLYDFECFSGFNEKQLFWAAARQEKIRFKSEDWTVDFLLPYDPGPGIESSQSEVTIENVG